jgi:hypothetical protein
MKALIFINLVMILSFFQLQAQQILYKDRHVAWNGIDAYYDNGILAWNGIDAYYDNGILAWNGIDAYHDNRQLAWNGTAAYYENGQILATNLYNQIQGVDLNNSQPNELEVSRKIKLITKKFNNRIYVVGLKIQLSEKNAIFINKENKLTTNIIQLDTDIHFEIQNKKAKLSILGQNVIK